MTQNDKLKPVERVSLLIFAVEVGWFGTLCVSYEWIKAFFAQEKEKVRPDTSGMMNSYSMFIESNLKSVEFLAVLAWIAMVVHFAIHLICLKEAVCMQSPKKIKNWCRTRDFWIIVMVSLSLISMYYKTTQVFMIMPILAYVIFSRLVIKSLLEVSKDEKMILNNAVSSASGDIKLEEV